MASSSRSFDHHNHVDPTMIDEFYFSALFDADELFPISDEKYAEELALQEALISSTSRAKQITFSRKNKKKFKSDKKFKGKAVISLDSQSSSDEDTQHQNLSFCDICMDTKPYEQMFENDKCPHSFCSDCVSKYVATKIQENISTLRCPDPKCDVVLEPHLCRSIVPEQVIERWESALCEALFFSSAKIYCPYRDCSAMMVADEDDDEAVTMSECPNCHRLFCARCNVTWHEGFDCEGFKAKMRNGSSEKEDKMAVELAKKEKWRRCPGCKFYVEKNEGCIHISCRCGKEFCYKCGSNWTSTHSC